MISMIQEQEKIIFYQEKENMKWNKDLNGNNILNYIHKRVILIYKVPLSWRDH